MDIKSINSNSKNTNQKNHIKVPGYYEWDINSKQKILKYFKIYNKPLENLKQNLLSPNKNDSLNLAVTDLTNILINLSIKCLKFKSRSNEKERKKNEYFGSDCYSKRKELQRLGKLLSEKPNDIKIRESYFQTKKLYKNMIKLKKGSFKENILKLIGDLGHTDISQKWQILKSLTEGGEIKDDPAEEISLDRWKQCFQELYNNNQVDDNLPKNFSVEKKHKEIGKGVLETIKLILNCPFSQKEILSKKFKIIRS